LDIVQKIWAPQKTLRPSWCPKLVTGLVGNNQGCQISYLIAQFLKSWPFLKCVGHENTHLVVLIMKFSPFLSRFWT